MSTDSLRVEESGLGRGGVALLTDPAFALGLGCNGASSAGTLHTQKAVDVVLGAQWGDEGKGKLVDNLAQHYDVCARSGGGSNAGHTIVTNGKTYKFHLLPSGMLNTKSVGVIGNGVVIHIPTLIKEMTDLKEAGICCDGRLKISDRAHIVFSFHMMADSYIEGNLGARKIGTTGRGIGPAYSSKILRQGLRMGDLLNFDSFVQRLRVMVDYYKRVYGNSAEVNIDDEIEYYRKVRDTVLPFVTDTISYTNKMHSIGKRILIEGANAAMLDIDLGTYPYVTSSNPTIGGACTGLGVPPNKLGHIYGTVKSYCTRVGEGPFPTELSGTVAEFLREKGGEYGTTTSRPRRIGWIDIAQLKFSCMVNGYETICLTKLDVLTGLQELKLGVSYSHSGNVIDNMPSSVELLNEIEVDYEILPGWSENIIGIRHFKELPVSAQRYTRLIEELIGIPIRWLGVGPDREDLIEVPSN
eukprot:95118_1